MILPGSSFPEVTIRNANGASWRLPADTAGSLTMLVVYRGLHCGICKSYLTELSGQVHHLDALGVRIIAVSSDTQDKALQAQHQWTGDRIAFGFGLEESTGRVLRLFLTAKRKDGEPDRFFEPGMYLINPDGTTLFVSVQNMPFGRPGISEMVSRIGWVTANQIPPRGTVAY